MSTWDPILNTPCTFKVWYKIYGLLGRIASRTNSLGRGAFERTLSKRSPAQKDLAAWNKLVWKNLVQYKPLSDTRHFLLNDFSQIQFFQPTSVYL